MNEQLPQFINAAKTLIYDDKRAKPLLAMMSTKTGAVNAVHVVMSVIEQTKPIPPEMSGDLGLSIFALLLDIFQQATGEKVQIELVQQVIQELKTEQQPPAQPEQTPPQGLINQGA